MYLQKKLKYKEDEVDRHSEDLKDMKKLEQAEKKRLP
ncbi:rCG63196, partial [Rattus norvegicus]